MKRHQAEFTMRSVTHSGRSWRRAFLHWVRALLWVVLLIALGSAGYTVIRAQIYQDYQTYALYQALQGRAGASSWPAPALSLSPRAHPGSPIGQLEIPRLHLSVMILEGTDDRALRLGLGHINQTAFPGNPGNVGIAGHRDTFFRALRGIRANDLIQITTLYGSFRYSVQSTEIVKPQDTWVLKASSRPALTLVTCYPFYYVGPAPRRFVVHSIQTDTPVSTDLQAGAAPGGPS
jgi:sortase A